jgi:acyl carrier protein
MDKRLDTPAMSIDEFCAWLSARFERPLPAVVPEATLTDDLEFDSINLLELVVELEEAVGGDVVLPIELLINVWTVRDAYLQYCTLSQLPLDDRRGQQ